MNAYEDLNTSKTLPSRVAGVLAAASLWMLGLAADSSLAIQAVINVRLRSIVGTSLRSYGPAFARVAGFASECNRAWKQADDRRYASRIAVGSLLHSVGSQLYNVRVSGFSAKYRHCYDDPQRPSNDCALTALKKIVRSSSPTELTALFNVR
jgi:hypothetical protein